MLEKHRAAPDQRRDGARRRHAAARRRGGARRTPRRSARGSHELERAYHLRNGELESVREESERRRLALAEHERDFERLHREEATLRRGIDEQIEHLGRTYAEIERLERARARRDRSPTARTSRDHRGEARARGDGADRGDEGHARLATPRVVAADPFMSRDRSARRHRPDLERAAAAGDGRHRHPLPRDGAATRPRRPARRPGAPGRSRPDAGRRRQRRGEGVRARWAARTARRLRRDRGAGPARQRRGARAPVRPAAGRSTSTIRGCSRTCTTPRPSGSIRSATITAAGCSSCRAATSSCAPRRSSATSISASSPRSAGSTPSAFASIPICAA